MERAAAEAPGDGSKTRTSNHAERRGPRNQGSAERHPPRRPGDLYPRLRMRHQVREHGVKDSRHTSSHPESTTTTNDLGYEKRGHLLRFAIRLVCFPCGPATMPTCTAVARWSRPLWELGGGRRRRAETARWHRGRSPPGSPLRVAASAAGVISEIGVRQRPRRLPRQVPRRPAAARPGTDRLRGLGRYPLRGQLAHCEANIGGSRALVGSASTQTRP